MFDVDAGGVGYARDAVVRVHLVDAVLMIVLQELIGLGSIKGKALAYPVRSAADCEGGLIVWLLRPSAYLLFTAVGRNRASVPVDGIRCRQDELLIG